MPPLQMKIMCREAQQKSDKVGREAGVTQTGMLAGQEKARLQIKPQTYIGYLNTMCHVSMTRMCFECSHDILERQAMPAQKNCSAVCCMISKCNLIS